MRPLTLLLFCSLTFPPFLSTASGWSSDDIWLGYPVIPIDDPISWWADTGSWLGWVNIDHFDEETGIGWIWIISTETRAYIHADTNGENGAWLWLGKAG